MLGNEGRTIINGFVFDELDDPTGTALVENQIKFLLGGVDTTPPVIQCPSDIVVQTTPGHCNAIVHFDVSATDDRPEVVISCTPASGSVFPVGTTAVACTATDAAGNTSQCSFTVTVEDNESPTVVTQGLTLQLDASGNASIVPADVNNGSSDNCGIASMSVSPNTFTCADVGPNEVTLTVTDVHGNSASAPAVVVVEDSIAPSVVTQGITIQLDASGNASIVPANVDNGSSDNCGIASMSVSPNAFTCADVGPNGVTLTVTDIHGNSASANAVVVVEDTIAPDVLTQDITVNLDDAGAASITPANVDNGSSDNCGIASMSVSPNTFNCEAVGSNTVTLTVTDTHGNTASATATVTIVDVTPPVITTCPVPLVLECDGDGNVAEIQAWLATFAAEDACGIAELADSFAGLSDGCGATGDATVTFTATDVNGNQTTCESTVIVLDTTAPELGSDTRDIYPYEAPITFTITADDICSDTDLVLSYDCHAINGAGKEISKLDSCDIEIVGNQVTIHDGGGVGTIITIFATGTDDCGNAQSEEYVVNVLRPANEGVGNGEDADTPGHDNNGGNDGPDTSPGNPGAKGKKK